MTLSPFLGKTLSDFGNLDLDFKANASICTTFFAKNDTTGNVLRVWGGGGEKRGTTNIFLFAKTSLIAKVNNFCDFLLDSLDKSILPQSCLLLT